MTASINRIWKSLTLEDKTKIKEKLGIDTDFYKRSSDRFAVLAQYYEKIGGCPPGILNTQYTPHMLGTPYQSRGNLESGLRPILRMLPSSGESLANVVNEDNDDNEEEPVIPRLSKDSSQRTITLARKKDYNSLSCPSLYKPVAVIHQFLQKAGEYVAIVALSLAGAYGGFSAVRYTDLAKELRRMEKNTIVQTYQIAHRIESFQELREWDFLSPDREEIAKDQQYIDTAKSVAKGAGGVTKWLVGHIPIVGNWSKEKIEGQQNLVNNYIQKRSEYLSKMKWYTLVGAGCGLGIGVFLSLRKEKKKRHLNE